MKIDVQVKVKEDLSTSEVASGWVELEDCIKFPVRVRKYMDKEEQKEKMFVSYPQRKSGKGYENIIYPQDKEVREEINAAVLEKIGEALTKGIDRPPITEVSVTLLETGQRNKKVMNRGVATIKVAGCIINGIMVKEGEHGLFVQMPQHLSGDGGYHDTVYGTNSFIQTDIWNEVLHTYQAELSLQAQKQMEKQEKSFPAEDVPKSGTQEPEENVPESGTQELEENVQDFGTQTPEKDKKLDQTEGFHLLSEAFDKKDVPRIKVLLQKLVIDVDPSQMKGDEVILQFAIATNGEDSVLLRFSNNCGDQPFHKEGVQKLEASLYQDGNAVRNVILSEKHVSNAEEAERNYQEMYQEWRMLTGQVPVEKGKMVRQDDRVPEKQGPKL